MKLVLSIIMMMIIIIIVIILILLLLITMTQTIIILLIIIIIFIIIIIVKIITTIITPSDFSDRNTDYHFNMVIFNFTTIRTKGNAGSYIGTLTFIPAY